MALKDITGQSAKTSRAFRDIAIGLSRNTFTNDAGIVKNDNSVKQSIRNLVMTTPGEKPFPIKFLLSKPVSYTHLTLPTILRV